MHFSPGVPCSALSISCFVFLYFFIPISPICFPARSTFSLLCDSSCGGAQLFTSAHISWLMIDLSHRALLLLFQRSSHHLPKSPPFKSPPSASAFPARLLPKKKSTFLPLPQITTAGWGSSSAGGSSPCCGRKAKSTCCRSARRILASTKLQVSQRE